MPGRVAPARQPRLVRCCASGVRLRALVALTGLLGMVCGEQLIVGYLVKRTNLTVREDS
jgi:hypothetical protein